MASKYIRVGAAFNGNGTSSALATVAGGAGAWNTINYLTGTTPAYGSIGAADVIYIRSKDETGAGLSVSYGSAASMSLGTAAGTPTAPITWILDDGTIWAGINGTLTFNKTGTGNYQAIFLDNNMFVSKTRGNWAIKSFAGSDVGNPYTQINDAAQCIGLAFDNSPGTLSSRGENIALYGTLIDPVIKIKYVYGTGAIKATVSKKATLISPDIELLDAVETGPLFFGSGNAASVQVVGGKIYGAGATSTGMTLCKVNSVYGQIELIGTEYPVAMRLAPIADWVAAGIVPMSLSSYAADNLFGTAFESDVGSISSRNDGNFPVLSAYLPDTSSTKFSYRCDPYGASVGRPLAVKSVDLYSDTAATKTITKELLISNDFSGANDRSRVWLDIIYIDDATGNKTFVTSRLYAPGTALTSSTANWLPSSNYGLTSTTKLNLSLTTPTDIKQNTPIVAIINIGLPQVDYATDVIFVDNGIVVS